MASIDQDQVNQAAEALAARNQRVTIGNVRTELGSGSFSTIAPLVKTWKAQHVAEAIAVGALPDEVHKAVERVAHTIRSAAGPQTARRIEQIKADADQRVADAEAEVSEALSEVRRLEKILADREADYQTLEKALAGARRSSSDYAATAQVRETTIKSLKEQLIEKRSEAAAAGEKLDELREQLGTEKTRADEAERQLKAERNDHAETSQSLDEARRVVESQRSRADRAEERLATAHQTIDELKQDIARNQAEAREAVQTIERERAMKITEAHRVAELEKERDALKAKAERVDRLEKELEQMRTEGDDKGHPMAIEDAENPGG